MYSRNKEELAVEERNELNTQNVTRRSDTGPLTHQPATTTGSRPTTYTNPSSTSHHVCLSSNSGRVEGVRDGKDVPSVETPSTHVDAIRGSDYDGDIDMNDFEDFLNEAEEDSGLLQDDSYDHVLEGDHGDMPGHEEWPIEDHYHGTDPSHVNTQDRISNKFQTLHSIGMLNPSHTRSMNTAQSSKHQSYQERIECDDSRTASQHSGTKTKLSLKQKSSKSRTCVVPQPPSSTCMNPPVASIKPFQHQDKDALSEQANDPVSLESFSELAKTSWKLCPMVKVKVDVNICLKNFVVSK